MKAKRSVEQSIIIVVQCVCSCVHLCNQRVFLFYRDSKNNSNKTKAATVTVEIEEPSPKKKPRVSSTNPKKGSGANKRRNSTKTGATNNSVSIIDADIMADNTGKPLHTFVHSHIDSLAYGLYIFL